MFMKINVLPHGGSAEAAMGSVRTRNPEPAIVTPVMRPLVPERDSYDALVNGIFARAHFTNEGPLVGELTREVGAWLGVEHCQLVSSGAAALGLALKAVGVAAPRARVVTTPFTFAASAHAITLAGLTPVFADVDPDTLCLDPGAAAEAVDDDTGAILATHVFGGPCDVEAFAALGRRHNVRIVYDGAHAFGTTIAGRSIFAWGDASALSFHATKIFHTVEGGALVTATNAQSEYVRIAKGHGIDGMDVPLIGPNAKMSELHAAAGLVLLPRIHAEIAARKAIHTAYRAALSGLPLRFLVPGGCDWNHAYCPILLGDEATVLRVKGALAECGIGARRYFYPALNTLPYYGDTRCPVAEDAARRVLCLPFGSWLSEHDQDRICTTIARSL